jgi:DNA-binding MarR family transcriptional regulator
VLSALANRPGSTASDVSDVLGMNKAICSKSVNTLLDRELIAQLNGARGFRHLYLTPRGVSVHDDCLAVALKRQEILLDPLSPAEVAQLNALLVRMLGSSASLERFEREVLSEDQRS